LVGFSYGGIGSLLAAAMRPDAVLSLTLIEPIVLGLAPDHPAVTDLRQRLADVYATPDAGGVRRALRPRLGIKATPAEPDEVTRQRFDEARRERPPYEADLDLRPIAEAPFPKLVFAGVWHPAFDALCNLIATRIGAYLVVLPGTHGVQHRPQANRYLVDTWGARAPMSWLSRRLHQSVAAGAVAALDGCA
jgi:pimeloyl-ACP methyl ester carboxylesterase